MLRNIFAISLLLGAALSAGVVNARTSLNPDLYSVELVTDQGFEQFEFKAHKQIIIISEPVNIPIPFKPSDSFRIAVDAVNAHLPENAGEALPIGQPKVISSSISKIERGDFDGDGLTDLFVSTSGGAYFVVYGAGDKNIPGRVKYLSGVDDLEYIQNFSDYSIGDFDGNGVSELGYYRNGTLIVAYRFTSNGSYQVSLGRVDTLSSMRVAQQDKLVEEISDPQVFTPSELKFNVSDLRGELNVNLPIVLPASDFPVPNLSISKVAGTKVGAFGVGWDLQGLDEITHCSWEFDEFKVSDRQYCMNGELLKDEYATRHMSSVYSREWDVSSYVISDGSFYEMRGNGLKVFYGGANDHHGNNYPVTFYQNAFDGKSASVVREFGLLSAIEYDDISVEFEYIDALTLSQTFSSDSGLEEVQSGVVKNIVVKKDGVLIKKYYFNYKYDFGVQLSSFQECAYKEEQEACKPLYEIAGNELNVSKTVYNPAITFDEFKLGDFQTSSYTNIETPDITLSFGEVVSSTNELITAFDRTDVSLATGGRNHSRRNYAGLGERKGIIPLSAKIGNTFAYPSVRTQQADGSVLNNGLALEFAIPESQFEYSVCVDYGGGNTTTNEYGTVSIGVCNERGTVTRTYYGNPYQSIALLNNNSDLDLLAAVGSSNTVMGSTTRQVDSDGDGLQEILIAQVREVDTGRNNESEQDIYENKLFLKVYNDLKVGGGHNVKYSGLEALPSLPFDTAVDINVYGPYNNLHNNKQGYETASQVEYLITVKAGSSYNRIFRAKNIPSKSTSHMYITEINMTDRTVLESSAYFSLNADGDEYEDRAIVTGGGLTIYRDLYIDNNELKFSSITNYPEIRASQVTSQGSQVSNAVPFDFNRDGIDEIIVEGKVYFFDGVSFRDGTDMLAGYDIQCTNISCLKITDYDSNGQPELMEWLGGGQVALHRFGDSHAKVKSIAYDGVDIFQAEYDYENGSFQSQDTSRHPYGLSSVTELISGRLNKLVVNAGTLGWSEIEYDYEGIKHTDGNRKPVFANVTKTRVSSSEKVSKLDDRNINTSILHQEVEISAGVAPISRIPYMASREIKNYSSTGHLNGPVISNTLTPVETDAIRRKLTGFYNITFNSNSRSEYTVGSKEFVNNAMSVFKSQDGYGRLEERTTTRGSESITQNFDYLYAGNGDTDASHKSLTRRNTIIDYNGELTEQTTASKALGSQFVVGNIYTHPTDSSVGTSKKYEYKSYGRTLWYVQDSVAVDTPESLKLPSRRTMFSQYEHGRPKTVTQLGVSSPSILSYDVWGNVLTKSLPSGDNETYVYNEFGMVTSVITDTGTSISIIYDKCESNCIAGAKYQKQTTNNVTKQINIEYYDVNANKVGVARSRPDGQMLYSFNVYDSKGRVSSEYIDVTSPSSSVMNIPTVSYLYNDNDQVTEITRKSSMVDTGLSESVITYDYAITNDGLLEVTETKLAATETVDQNVVTTNQRVSKKYYEAETMKLVKAIQSSGAEYIYTYDPKGNVKEVTITGEHSSADTSITQTYTQKFDRSGNVVESQRPGRAPEFFKYSPWGELLTHTYADGATVDYKYDNVGRISSEKYLDAVGAVIRNYGWQYYPATGLLENVHAVNADNSQQILQAYTYYDNGTLNAESLTYGSYDMDKVHHYDANGRPQHLEFKNTGVTNSDMKFTFAYDPNNAYLQNVEAKAPDKPAGFNVWSHSDFDAKGRRIEEHYFNERYTLNNEYETHTGALRYKALSYIDANGDAVLGESESLFWDAHGDLRLRESPIDMVSQDLLTMTYDADQRLTSEAGSLASDTVNNVYSYDDFGNFIAKDTLENTYDYHAIAVEGGTTYNSVITSTDSNGTVSYGDNDLVSGTGRMTNLDGYDIRYTTTGRVKDVTRQSDGYRIDFEYGPGDALLSTSYSDGRKVTFFGGAEILEDPSGLTIYRYKYKDAVVARYNGSVSKFVKYKDARGSIRSLWNGQGELVGTQSYDAYGAPLEEASDMMWYVTDAGYTGHLMLKDMPFIYMNARLFSYELGTFTSTDPIFADMHMSGGLNAYGYAGGSPYRYWDPSGMSVENMTPLPDLDMALAQVELNQFDMLLNNALNNPTVDWNSLDGNGGVRINGTAPSGTITVEMNGIKMEVDAEMYYKNIGTEYLAKEAGVTYDDYNTLTTEEAITAIDTVAIGLAPISGGGSLLLTGISMGWSAYDIYDTGASITSGKHQSLFFDFATLTTSFAMRRLGVGLFGLPRNSGELDGVIFLNEFSNYAADRAANEWRCCLQ